MKPTKALGGALGSPGSYGRDSVLWRSMGQSNVKVNRWGHGSAQGKGQGGRAMGWPGVKFKETCYGIGQAEGQEEELWVISALVPVLHCLPAMWPQTFCLTLVSLGAVINKIWIIIQSSQGCCLRFKLRHLQDVHETLWVFSNCWLYPQVKIRLLINSEHFMGKERKVSLFNFKS